LIRSETIVTPGCSSWRSERENTSVVIPGASPPATSNVRRPINKVSNSSKSAWKSMSGSMTIQSYSSVGPAM
jgi:hypothetical protein